MTTKTYLDRDALTPPEPEGDASHREWISVFAVPYAVEWERPGDKTTVARLRFFYPGGETGEAIEALDELSVPAVTVCTARHTGKVLEMWLEPPADANTLRSVADRLVQRAQGSLSKAKKFSFLMISRVAQLCADKLGQ
jgi:hypothetical protein